MRVTPVRNFIVKGESILNKDQINTPNNKQGLSTCTEAYKEHIMHTFNAFCNAVIRYATINSWCDRSKRRQREISFEYLIEEKFYPFSTYYEYHDVWSYNYPYKRKSCCRTVISAREKEGNHLSLLFRALHTAGNWGAIWKLPEYGVASHTQCFTYATEKNGGVFA